MIFIIILTCFGGGEGFFVLELLGSPSVSICAASVA